jgi:adenylate cyclase class 2
MSREIELKVAVADHAEVTAALEAAGAVYVGEMVQTDRFFDTPDASLRGSDRGLRIRSAARVDGWEGERDTRQIVTFKGPREAASGLKIRPEYETAVDDAEVLVRVFAACGLGPMLTIQKRRTTWRLDECLVELDELPAIGRFVEVEGPGAEAVEAVRRKLPLGGEAITDSYVAMLSAHYGSLPAGAEVTLDAGGIRTRRGS